MKKATKEDFSRLTEFYRMVCEKSPQIDIYCRWNYGLHPADDIIAGYLARNAMYYLEEDGGLLAAFALTGAQGEDYHPISWRIDAKDDEVAVLHLLAVHPDRQGRGLAKGILQEVLAKAKEEGKKAVRLDALICNTPAQHLYERCGFRLQGKQNWYAGNSGWIDFLLYEYVLE